MEQVHSTCNDNKQIDLIEQPDTDLDEAVDIFNRTVIEAYKAASKKPHKRHKQNHWYTPQIGKQILRKHKLYRKLVKLKSKYPDQQHNNVKMQLQAQTKKVKRLIRNEKKNSWSRFVNAIKESHDIRDFWKQYKRSRGEAPARGAPTFRRNVGASRASILNQYFADMGQPDVKMAFDDPRQPPIVFADPDHKISVNEVKQVIKDSSTRKAAGHDQITNIMLKHLPPKALVLLTALINRSWTSGIVPRQWKQAVIAPIPKKPIPNAPSDYRPISLLSCVGKILEKIVTTKITNEVQDKSILSDYQFGFRKHTSCTHALLRFTSSIHTHIHEGVNNGSTAVLLDLKAAYDSVNRLKLLSILKDKQIDQQIFQWLCDYMSDRHIQTKVTMPDFKQEVSEWISCDRGVPQGSPISPILFNLYINEVTTAIRQSALPNSIPLFQLYADDLIIWCNHHDPAIAQQQIQHTLNELQFFMSNMELRINSHKCQSIGFSRFNHQIWHDLEYDINGNDIPTDNKPRYLGIYLDCKPRLVKSTQTPHQLQLLNDFIFCAEWLPPQKDSAQNSYRSSTKPTSNLLSNTE